MLWTWFYCLWAKSCTTVIDCTRYAWTTNYNCRARDIMACLPNQLVRRIWFLNFSIQVKVCGYSNRMTRAIGRWQFTFHCRMMGLVGWLTSHCKRLSSIDLPVPLCGSENIDNKTAEKHTTSLGFRDKFRAAVLPTFHSFSTWRRRERGEDWRDGTGFGLQGLWANRLHR